MKTQCIGLWAAALLLAPLSAQPQIEARLSADLQEPPKQVGEVSEADKKLVIQKTALLLSQHVTFRNDGVAASYYDSPYGPHYVEWQNLRIKTIVPTRLHANDPTQGVNKRIQVLLTYDATRLLNPKTNVWSPWGNRGHPLFPPAINFAWQNGHCITDGGLHLPKFHKGPLASQATAKDAPVDEPGQPATTGGTPTQGTITRPSGSGGLPPGMKKK